ncbi:hypothetical protein BJ166DRAFT_516922 [Pestalotiopsis sp. NC0098]|nr:hypothetical protein BJ166DRAFT_516922 [Pestalotiopsis sp. NC0098]
MFLWNVASADTIFPIAEPTGRGVCDVARANSMADAELVAIDDTLLANSYITESTIEVGKKRYRRI